MTFKPQKRYLLIFNLGDGTGIFVRWPFVWKGKLAFTINGGALTERVFSWPGIANEFISAVAGNDYPLAQACFLLLTLVVLVANLVVDILYAYLDPRIRY